MMELFDWKKWPGFFDVNFISIDELPLQEVFSDSELRLVTSPVKHLLPTIGLRFEFKQSGMVFVYSSDTEPTETVVELANNADVLIHEANGNSVGHSSREQCGEIASEAGVKNLYLIHYPTDMEPSVLIGEAQNTFSGQISVCYDFMEIELN
jgi:ribonuclease Z